MDPSDWLGLVTAFSQLLFYGEQPILAVFGEVPHRDAVNATRPCVGLHLLPSHPKGSFCDDFVDQTEPLVSFYPIFKGDEHVLGPYSTFGSVALPRRDLFGLFIRRRN